VCLFGIDNLQRRVQAKRMTNEQYEKVLSLLVPQLTYDNFQSLDIVIEAVIEDINLKVTLP
jgi:3-hydroxyacyl-CoA dehydrogenase